MMTPETRAIAQLIIAADEAATKCSACGVFGHDASTCPKLAHVDRPGISVQQIETADFDRAFNVFMSALWFAAGVGAMKLVEALWP
jgi:hypothetical protein